MVRRRASLPPVGGARGYALLRVSFSSRRLCSAARCSEMSVCTPTHHAPPRPSEGRNGADGERRQPRHGSAPGVRTRRPPRRHRGVPGLDGGLRVFGMHGRRPAEALVLLRVCPVRSVQPGCSPPFAGGLLVQSTPCTASTAARKRAALPLAPGGRGRSQVASVPGRTPHRSGRWQGPGWNTTSRKGSPLAPRRTGRALERLSPLWNTRLAKP